MIDSLTRISTQQIPGKFKGIPCFCKSQKKMSCNCHKKQIQEVFGTLVCKILGKLLNFYFYVPKCGYSYMFYMASIQQNKVKLTLMYTLPTRWSPRLSQIFISSISPYLSSISVKISSKNSSKCSCASMSDSITSKTHIGSLQQG